MLLVLATPSCTKLLGLQEDVAGGACKTNLDCRPSESCEDGVCQLAHGGPASGDGGATSVGSGEAGLGNGPSAGGDTSSAGYASAAAGDATTGGGPAGNARCGDSEIGDSVPCAELPDGTPIAFPGGTAQGPCQLGSKRCQEDGTFGACEGAIAPAQADCTSSEDENCDGEPDDTQCGVCTLAQTRYCYDGLEGTSGVGSCKDGTQVCELDASGQQTVWGLCAGEITPANSDSCDQGNDANCNGTPNEGCDCLNGATGTCGDELNAMGNCAAGTSKCAGGVWGNCSVVAVNKDSCNPGDDGTCNGIANEGCACVNGQTQGCGVTGMGCTPGSQTCQNGSYGACSGACGDFNVPASAKCTATAPNGEDTEHTCSVQVCDVGYHATGCSMFLSSGSGSCDYSGFDPTAPRNARFTTTKALAGSSATCTLTGCTCRHDGF
jgi:hypothetical protein